MNLKKKTHNTLQPILELQTWEDRYQYLINLGKTAPYYPTELKTLDQIIKGCQSITWLYLKEEEGLLKIQGTSNSIFARGFIYLLILLYSGENTKEIQEESTPFFSLIGFQEMLTPQRGQGLLAIYNKIKNYNR